MLPMEEGREPMNKLEFKKRVARLLMLLMEEGREPVNKLEFK
jgi:hypothetical protein